MTWRTIPVRTGLSTEPSSRGAALRVDQPRASTGHQRSMRSAVVSARAPPSVTTEAQGGAVRFGSPGNGVLASSWQPKWHPQLKSLQCARAPRPIRIADTAARTARIRPRRSRTGVEFCADSHVSSPLLLPACRSARRQSRNRRHVAEIGDAAEIGAPRRAKRRSRAECAPESGRRAVGVFRPFGRSAEQADICRPPRSPLLTIK